MDTATLHSLASAEFDRRVEAIGEEQWHSPTPCVDWDVHALVNHLVNENAWTAPLLAGQTIDEVGDRFDGDLLGDDPKGAWKRSMEEATAAAQAQGALDRKVHLSSGDSSSEEYVFQLFTDLLVHAWDLARGIGADEALDPELVEACYRRVQPQEKELKATGAYGSHIDAPEGADRQTQLLALFGRTA